MAKAEAQPMIADPLAAVKINDYKKNRIQVSNTKKPLFFYLNLAKRYIKQHNDVELSALGMAIPTVVTIAEILKANGLAMEKRVAISTVGSKDENKGRLVQKAKLEIVLEKNDKSPTSTDGNDKSPASTDGNDKSPTSTDGNDKSPTSTDGTNSADEMANPALKTDSQAETDDSGKNESKAHDADVSKEG